MKLHQKWENRNVSLNDGAKPELSKLILLKMNPFADKKAFIITSLSFDIFLLPQIKTETELKLRRPKREKNMN